MNFPFNTKMEYLRPVEKKAIEEFLATNPQPGDTYTNGDGESRQMMKYWLPKGVVTALTVTDVVNIPPDNSRYYHTPLATLDDVVAKVQYMDPETKVWGECDSNEWVEWLGDKTTIESKDERLSKLPLDPVSKMVAAQKKAFTRGTSLKANFEESDKEAAKAKGEGKKKWRKQSEPIKK